MSDSPARVAADVAATYPIDHPVAAIARRRLAQEASMIIDPRDLPDPGTVGGKLHDAAADPKPEDTPTLVGTPLRDAAVDPHPEDFLAPVNAGKPGPEGNPHGPTVAAYEVGSLARRVAVEAHRSEAGR